MKEVFIVSTARTPIGAFGGTLSTLSATDLGALAIQNAVKKSGLEFSQIEEVFMGNVLSANLGQAPTKIAALQAGIAVHTPCTSVNKVCASGMKAIMLATQAIRLGDIDIAVAGGMESMSRAPFYVPNARYGYRYGNGEFLDAIVRDALQDPYKKYMMGNAGEICAKKYSFSRQEQDEYAMLSYQRAQKAYQDKIFEQELISVAVKTKKGEIQVTEDEEYDKVDFDKMKKLKPAFDKEGTITAANASKINDGGAAVVLVSGEKVKEFGLTPLAKIVAYADASQEPDLFTTTPAFAMPKAIKKAGLTLQDISYFEINEAFSVVALANIKEMNLDADKVNIYGGAVSLGHPVGVSGVRITMALLNALRNNKARFGAAGICNGGGGASALVLEAL